MSDEAHGERWRESKSSVRLRRLHWLGTEQVEVAVMIWCGEGKLEAG